MTVVLKRTSFGDRRFDNLRGSHLQNQLNSVCKAMCCKSGPLTLIGQTLEMNATTTSRREKSVILVTN